MRPVQFGEALPAGIRLTLFSENKPDRFFTVFKFWLDETSGIALALKTGVPSYQVEDEEGRIHLLLHLPIEEKNEDRSLCVSQTRAVQSSEAVMIRSPSGLNCADQTAPSCLNGSVSAAPLCASQTRNFFKARADDVYVKLQKAAQLAGSPDLEDAALLLTEVRRALNAAADFFYPPVQGISLCSDGKERELGDDKYLNRLHEFLSKRLNFKRSFEGRTGGARQVSATTKRLSVERSTCIRRADGIETRTCGAVFLSL